MLRKKGEAHLYKREFAKARATFDAALSSAKGAAGAGAGADADAALVASAAYGLGVAHHYLKDPSRAALSFRECARLRAQHGACPAVALLWIGRQHERLAEPEKALGQFLSALCVYKKRQHPIDYRVVAKLLHAAGGVYERNEDCHDMALKCE